MSGFVRIPPRRNWIVVLIALAKMVERAFATTRVLDHESLNTTQGEGSAGCEGNTSTNPNVFWGVNAFILVLIFTVCSWCWCFGGLKHLVQSNQQESDRRYRNYIMQRQQQRAESRQMTPAERKKAILQSLRRNQVKMIVAEGDLVDDSHHNVESSIDFTCRKPLNQISEMPDDEEVVVSFPQSMQGSEHGLPSSAACDGESDDKGAARDATTDSQVRDEDVVVSFPPSMEGFKPGLPSSASCEGESDDEEAAWDATTASQVHGTLILRNDDNSKPGKVPNQCAICLGSYHPGDAVVWSSNPDCPHAFHEDCLLDWLVHSQQDGTPCPCCRQAFTDLRTFRKQKKISWEPGRAFDLGAMTLR